MGRSNKKIRTALYIGIVASIFSVIALAVVVLYPFFLAKDLKAKGIGPDYEKRYVSEYPMDFGECRTVLDNWYILKTTKKDGTKYLKIRRIIGLDEPIDYLDFEVYDSSSDAEKEYRFLRKEYKEYNHGFKDCDGYFKSYEPDVDDGSIYQMVFLKDNVIIFANLSVESCYVNIESTTAADERTDEPTSQEFDRASLENYIIKNQDAIKEFVLEELLKI